MKTLTTILITIIILFLLLFAVTEILNVEIKFEKSDYLEQEKSAQNENKKIEQGNMLEENKQKNTTESAQDITELSAQILKPGVGERQVKAGDQITVHYAGILVDGTKFDSSVDRGEPFSLTIGAGKVIQGWDQGIIGMKVNEQRRLFVPSEFAYGEQGAGELIGPNTDLIFDIELISIDNEDGNLNNEEENIIEGEAE